MVPVNAATPATVGDVVENVEVFGPENPLLARRPSQTFIDARSAAIRDRYLVEYTALSAYIGRVRSLMEASLGMYGTVEGRLALERALAAKVPERWQPDSPAPTPQ